jgi:hypothetical protein
MIVKRCCEPRCADSLLNVSSGRHAGRHFPARAANPYPSLSGLLLSGQRIHNATA